MISIYKVNYKKANKMRIWYHSPILQRILHCVSCRDSPVSFSLFLYSRSGNNLIREISLAEIWPLFCLPAVTWLYGFFCWVSWLASSDSGRSPHTPCHACWGIRQLIFLFSSFSSVGPPVPDKMIWFLSPVSLACGWLNARCHTGLMILTRLAKPGSSETETQQK